ncbi:MAG: hypothetical protein ONA69_09880, partial [candidate division KSB1 bacterium]|nr:hypothetical protein [candidate division KSB1 bacterium]
LTVSLFAAAAGKADISLGNVIGSNFVTLTFVTALCALISPIVVRTEIKERESSWMILSTTAIFLLAIDGRLSRLDGVILMLLYLPYLAAVVREAVQEAKTKQNELSTKDPRILLHFIAGIAGIFAVILGAKTALVSGESIGKILGLAPAVLGILIFAFGTSLPELAIALSATLRKKADISIGEVYSSNIFTALFILGACAVVMPMTLFENPAVPSVLVKYDIPFLILAGVIIQIFVTTGSILKRGEALIILLLYVYFVVIHFVPGLLPF